MRSEEWWSVRLDEGDQGNLRSLGGIERLVRRISRGLRRERAADSIEWSVLSESDNGTAEGKAHEVFGVLDRAQSICQLFVYLLMTAD